MNDSDAEDTHKLVPTKDAPIEQPDPGTEPALITEGITAAINDSSMDVSKDSLAVPDLADTTPWQVWGNLNKYLHAVLLSGMTCSQPNLLGVFYLSLLFVHYIAYFAFRRKSLVANIL